MFRYIVLGLLRNGRSLHGYALMKAHEERSGLRIGTGNFYRQLNRLLAEGLVRAVPSTPGEDSRRTPYSITSSGTRLFESWLTGRPGERAETDDELAARTLFFPGAEPAVARQMLSHWSDSLWMRSKVLERERKAALDAEQNGNTTDFSSRTLLISRRLAHVAADIEFVDRLTASYETWLSTQEANARPGPLKAPITERKHKVSRK